MAYTADGKQVFFVCKDQTVRVWDAAGKKQLRSLRAALPPVQSLIDHTVRTAVSPGGGRVVSVGENLSEPANFEQVQVWDAATGKLLRRLKGHKGQLACVAFAPDGKRLLTGGGDGTLRLWDLGSGKELRVIKAHAGIVQSAAFSPDGRRLLSGGADNALYVWDTASGEEVRKLEEPVGSVNAVAFLPGGRCAVSGAGGAFSDKVGQEKGIGYRAGEKVERTGKGQAVRIWDLESGQVLWKFEQDKGAVVRVAVAADGRRLLTFDTSDVLRVWELPDPKALPGGAAKEKE
jgi:WD40 repeat protein